MLWWGDWLPTAWLQMRDMHACPVLSRGPLLGAKTDPVPCMLTTILYMAKVALQDRSLRLTLITSDTASPSPGVPSWEFPSKQECMGPYVLPDFHSLSAHIYMIVPAQSVPLRQLSSVTAVLPDFLEGEGQNEPGQQSVQTV